MPNCKDAKIKTFENLGPGVYEKEASSMLGEGHKRSNSDTGESLMNASSFPGGGQVKAN